MRRIRLALVVLAALAASYGLGRYHSRTGTAANGERRVLYYIDPMHPAYRSDKPGIAPDCGMKLEPVYAEDAGSRAASVSAPGLPAGTVAIDGPAGRLLGIRVAPVEKSAANHTVRVVGRVAPEDTRVYRVNAGTDGFIRTTYNDSVGTQVKKDQKLAAYYSPDFVAAASGFLAAVQRVPGAVGKDGARFTPNFPGTIAKEGVKSIDGYTDRLRFLGMSDMQIKHVADSLQLPDSIDVVAPADGFILARNITAGQHFDHDMEFYRIADLSRVWVVAEVYEREASYLRPGEPAQIALRDGGRRFAARVADSLPQSEPGGGTVKLRLEVDNPGFALRPDMLVDVDLPVSLPSAITVPLDALVDSGARARVYVERAEGVFEPREVETGWRFGDRVAILHGLQPNERVVVAATFLVDSESRLKTPVAVARNTPAPAAPMAMAVPKTAAPKTAKDPSCGMPVDPAKAAASGNTLLYRGATYYFCSRQCKQKFQDHSSSQADRRQGD